MSKFLKPKKAFLWYGVFKVHQKNFDFKAEKLLRNHVTLKSVHWRFKALVVPFMFTDGQIADSTKLAPVCTLYSVVIIYIQFCDAQTVTGKSWDMCSAPFFILNLKSSIGCLKQWTHMMLALAVCVLATCFALSTSLILSMCYLPMP